VPGSSRGIGWEHLHVAVDDHSRLAYTAGRAPSSSLPDETTRGACAFLERALPWLQSHGVKVERVMSGSGAAYQRHAFHDELANVGLKHKRTQPQTLRTTARPSAPSRLG
jgi:hypothetical protein